MNREPLPGAEQSPASPEQQLLSPEILKQRYGEVAALRTVNRMIGERRGKLRTTLNFLWRMVPGIVKTTLSRRESIDLQDIETLGIAPNTFSLLTDLAAFDLKSLRAGTLDLSTLSAHGMKDVVLMEDRDPQFFLNYDGFEDDATVPLNRHGNRSDRWTHADMKTLVERAHDAGLKITLGFWGNSGNHAKNPFIAKNWKALEPVIPLSDDINPLSFVQNAEGKEIPFADYVSGQYAKLHKDFGFDGLFLGDGLMGYRAFMDSEGPYDASDMTDLWTDFYQRVRTGIKQTHPNAALWAYDCMGNGVQEAKKHGLDLHALQPHIDRYVFQSYGSDAWGKDYMALPGYNLARDAAQIRTLPRDLAAKTLYTAGLSDRVEGWHSHKGSIRAKHVALGDFAKGGTLGVWSNDIVSKALKAA